MSGAAAGVGATSLLATHPSTAGGGAAAFPALALTTAAPTPTGLSVTSGVMSAAQIAAVVGPSVVTIELQANATGSNSPSANGTGGGQVVGSGSGVILTADGWILTNRHVAANATALTVVLADGAQYAATVKGVDTYTDFAIVKVDANNLPAVTLADSSLTQVGDVAYVIGNPLGQFPDSVTAGIVSGLDRTIDVASDTGQSSSTLDHLIQTDAAINPGNSGGAVVNDAGQVIGIATAASGSGQSLGFALPINLAKPVISQVEAGQTVARPWLGIRYQPVDAQLAKDNNLGVDQGAWVSSSSTSGGSPIVTGSPAEKAGLKANDIITAIDGQAIDAAHPLDLVVLAYLPGDTITLSVYRGGSTIQLTLTLATRPAPTGSITRAFA